MADEIIAEIEWGGDVDAELEAIKDDRRGLPSASEYPRVHGCPGYLNLKRKLPAKEAGPPGPYALSGQRVHAALADPIPQLIAALVGDEEQVFDWCRAQWDRLVELHWPQVDHDDIRERRFFLGGYFSGQIDRAKVSPRVIMGTDWKCGRIAVAPAESNLQIRAYAVLLDNAFPGRDEVIMSIIQPFVSKDPIVVGYGRAELDHSRRELDTTLKRAAEPDAKRIPGEHCRYCPCRKTCPEAWAVPTAVANVRPSELVTGAQIAAFLDRVPLAKQVIEAVETEAKRLLAENPEAVPGYRLKPGRTIAEITSPEIVYARVAALGVDQKAFMSAVKLGKEKLELAIRGATGLKGKALGQQLAEVISGCTSEKQAAPSLAKILS